ncbi:MAG: PD-(D/E)XK nuclease domain-containing protein [Victivallales bacterium]|nr:PD-(D/E)XK nuclease domain-containing protein [bacterium]MDD7752812.1 PD-(D/E)XK nuclease domain-containing protein [bacterium]MDY5695856.1 PD-(D/E)XK nuclease domain-containing protein [Victivallales bacterium]
MRCGPLSTIICGRIDAVAACGDWIYIFEFKLDQDADAALAQIRNMEYYQKYHKLGKRLILIGANFDSQKRQIADWLHKEL